MEHSSRRGQDQLTVCAMFLHSRLDFPFQLPVEIDGVERILQQISVRFDLVWNVSRTKDGFRKK
jgi:hypothetical protein